ncbi:ABC transporter permease [Vallitalea pronyensis]|uniref:ABC transporter permease n=2 Tax=Vallitalea pronyensis TaxID=1348613 RepID=A0A8J8MR21_9FIRM|nr:ABC transporter permease [Vallitalea pronyensis]
MAVSRKNFMKEKTDSRLFKLYDTLLPYIVVLIFLLFWQLSIRAGWVSSKKLAPPLDVLMTFINKLSNTRPDGATLQVNILQSLKLSLSGLFLGVAIGTPLGLLMGWYKPIERIVKPIFELLRPIPAIAWIPLTILWIGVGDPAKIMIIFFSAFVPCVLNSQSGIKQSKQVLINLAKTFGASNFESFVRIGIPSAMPMVFAGVRIALGNAWATLVAAELLAANAGLGYMITLGRQFGKPDLIILGMVVIGVLGFLFTYTFEKVEKKLLGWRL